MSAEQFHFEPIRANARTMSAFSSMAVSEAACKLSEAIDVLERIPLPEMRPSTLASLEANLAAVLLLAAELSKKIAPLCEAREAQRGIQHLVPPPEAQR